MHTFIINLFILLVTIFTFVDVRPVSKLEQNLIRQRRDSSQETSALNNHQMIGDIWNDIQPIFNNHINSHLSGSSEPGCKRTTYSNGDYVEYCLEKILNQNGKSYSTKTTALLYKIDGTIIPLHQAESAVEIETYNHHN
jgi:hypothetical protein